MVFDENDSRLDEKNLWVTSHPAENRPTENQKICVKKPYHTALRSVDATTPTRSFLPIHYCRLVSPSEEEEEDEKRANQQQLHPVGQFLLAFNFKT